MATCLLDTNILVYLANSNAPEHQPSVDAIARLLAAGDRLVVAPQVLFEFWTVATRDVSANGLGWTIAQARAAIESFRARFTVLAEPPEVIDFCLDLVTTHGIRGKRIHDAFTILTP